MILVVDDEPEILEVLRQLLEREGYDVVTANNGAEALKLLDGGLKPAVILSDMVMPKLNGNDFIAALSSRTEAPVLVLSAFVDEVRRETWQTVKGIFKKPLEVKPLLAAIREWAMPDHPRPA